ncbi:hypothetical protein Tco_0541118 [Tanacetum coccineum]
MHSRFEMSLLREMKFFLGLQIHQSPRGIFINQAKYALEILKKHGMDKGESIGTPMATKPKLDTDLSGKPVDQTNYHSKIGSLMYLTSSRPNIVQAVCYCACYQARPTEKHLKEVKRIFRYLRGTIIIGLCGQVPLLKQGDYEMWKIRIEQFFQIQDYALWEVIENRNSFKPTISVTTNKDGSSTSTTTTVPVTTEEKIQKKNDVKARSMLLMALPNEHLLTFSQYKDAKTLFEAIKARFGGNEATKKTQKTLLKQMYENFSAPSIESLDSIFNRLQKINVAFVSTPSSTNDVNTASVKVSTVSTPISTVSTNSASLSDATVYAFLANQPNGSQLVHEDLEQIHDDDLEEIDLKWNLALLSMRARKFYQRTRRKITIDRSDIAGGSRNQDYRSRNQDNRNKSQDSSKKTMNVEDTSPTVMIAIDGAGFDWSFMVEEEAPTNMALMAFF